MSRYRCFYGYLGGLGISYLTDHDDIGILTQYGTQRRRKGQISLDVYLNLVDTVNICLDGVLSSDNTV